MSRNKNVSGVAAIHHPLRDVNACAGDIGLLIEVSDFVDRAAVDSHADAQLGMAFQCFADLERAQNRRFRAGAKHQGATIAGRQP